MNLLLVEDDRRVSDFLVRGLRAEGYGVTLAVSGSEGLNFGLTGEFDLILLDLVLPGMPGLEVCQELRAPHVDAHPHADRPGHG
jgi:DNA-binding response OmpR family regulator